MDNLKPSAGPALGPEEFLGRLGALADPARLRVLLALERAELGVAELADVLQLPQSNVSRHLKALAEEGFLVSRRHGTAHLHRLRPAAMEPATRALWTLAREAGAEWATARQDRLRVDALVARRPRGGDAFFAKSAGRWEQLRAELYGESFLVPALAALCPPHWSVADLGCGTGQLARELAPHVARLDAVDRSPAMLEAAAHATRELGNVTLHEGSLEALPLPSASCDAALAVLVLTYVRDLDAALAESARVLVPGGRLVIVDLLAHDREDLREELGHEWAGFEPHELGEALGRAGLREPRVRLLDPARGARGPALLLATATREQG